MDKLQNTEDLIKEAARKVFTSKGLSASRMEDIAAEAGVTKALVNYYYRSKERLFEAIFQEEMLDRYLDSWATDIHQLSVISAEPYFDEQGRRQWAVVYQMAYGGYMITIMARMGYWLDEPLLEIEGRPI